MIDLKIEWPEIETLLNRINQEMQQAATAQGIPAGGGLNLNRVRKFHEEGLGEAGSHFYKIRYEPGEIIMAKGVHSDYAALHLRGAINVFESGVEAQELGPVPVCWDRPGPLLRRLENWVLDRTSRLKLKPTHPILGRDDNRTYKAREIWLAELLAGVFRVKARKRESALAQPPVTAERARAGAATRPRAEPIASIPSPNDGQPLTDRFIGVTSALWNEPRSVSLVASDVVELVLIKRKVLIAEIVKALPRLYQSTIDEFLTNVLPRRLKENRLFRGLPGLDLQVVRDLIVSSAPKGKAHTLVVHVEKKGQVIYAAGDPADALYLILSGMVRVELAQPGGPMVVNHLVSNGHFGESCVEPGLRKATVVAASPVKLLRIGREVVVEMASRFSDFARRLEEERAHTRRRGDDLLAGRRLPPDDPPQDIASQLVLTKNLLLIDMDRCTRCDQCVRGCAEAHEGIPRFHRANPSLRFGKWEVAGACLHCGDAPCQVACPVGAITLLGEGEVQIHRNRCIGCDACARACPFNVIEMLAPGTPEEAASLLLKKDAIATKCDLCLTSEHSPPCVVACPYGAAQRGDPGDLFPGLKGWATGTSHEKP